LNRPGIEALRNVSRDKKWQNGPQIGFISASESAQRMKLAWILTLIAILLADAALAATVTQFGETDNNWPATWTAETAVNDPSGDTSWKASDFYSGSDSTAAFAPDNDFLSLRVRINYAGNVGIQNATDYSPLTTDIGGNVGLSSWIKNGWSGPISVVPEPATGWLTGAGLLLLIVIQKCRHFHRN
jgi:hypothetical protein